MKLNPQQAPLYGDSVLTVFLSEEDEHEDDVVFYLLFAGSNLKHLASTKKIDSLTLKTIAPGHDCCETVKVSLCVSKKDISVLVVAEETFQFVQDEASDAAQFLASSAGNQQALIFTRFLDKSRPASGDASILDGKITLAFRHLSLPEKWNVLGTDKSIKEDVPLETLMHFAVRLDLLGLAWFLLQHPGGRESLSVHNNEGATPVSLALDRGFQKLYQLLTDEKASEPESWSSVSRVIHSGDFCVKHHRDLNIYTLTEKFQEGGRSSLDDSIGELRNRIQNHSRQTNASMQSQSEPGTTTDYLDLSENVEQSFSAEDPEAEVVFSDKNKQHVQGCVPRTEMTSAHTSCIGESDAESGHTKEANASDDLGGLGGESVEPPSESANHDFGPKKEEAGSIVAAESASVNCECKHGAPVEVSGVEIPPSCGNTSTEAVMTSTVVISNKESLSEIDHSSPEVKPPSEVPSVSGLAEETGSQGPTLEVCAGAMGQTVTCSSTEAVDSGQTQAFTASGEQDAYQTGADFVNVQSHQDAAFIRATDLACVALGSASQGELSGAVDCTREQDPATADVSSEINAPGTDVEEDVTFQVREAHNESLGGPSKGNVPCVEQCVHSVARAEAFYDEQLPPTDEVPSAHSETPEIGDSWIVAKAKYNGEETVEAENKNTDFELTELNLTDSTGPGEHQHSDVALVERDSAAPEYQTPDEDDKSFAILEGEAKNKDGELVSSGSETKGGTNEEVHNGISTEQEMGQCNSEVEAAQHLITAGEVAECSAVCSHSAVLQAPAVEVCPEADKELMQSQTCLLPHDSGPEQQLHRPAGGIILDASAIKLVREEVVQETELGSVSTPKEDDLMTNAEKPHVGAPSTGDETAARSGGELPSCSQSKHVQDSPSDTPFAVCDNRHKENQEVLEHGAAVTQHTDVILENALSAASEAEKDLRESGPFQTAASEETEASQVVCESGTPASGELLPTSTGAESSVEEEGGEPCTESSTGPAPAVQLRGTDEETNSDMAGGAKDGAARDLAAEEAQVPADDNTLGASLEQECDSNPSLDVIAPRSNAPESTAQPCDCEGTSQVEALVPMIEAAEGQSVNVTIPRVSLHPIAEEPLSGVDSSQDTTSSSSESEVSPREKEFGKNLLQEDEKDKSIKTGELLLTPDTPLSDCVDHPENASVTAFVKDSVVSLEFEISINTSATLDDQGLGESCAASSPHDICSPEVEPQSSSLSHPVLIATPTDIVATLQGDGDSGLELTEQLDDEDSSSLGVDEIEPVSESLDMKCEDEVDFAERLNSQSEDLINRESWCSVEPCPDPQLLENKKINESTECESFLEDGLGSESTSSQGVFQRESGSDTDIFHLPSDAMDDMVFAKPEEEHSPCDITSSSSSTDDATSLERTSSRGSDISLPRKRNTEKQNNRHSLDSSASSTAATAAEEQDNDDAEPAEMEGEEMDSITEVPVQVSLSRNSLRSLSPFRRHSWGPGKNTGADTEINQRSSMRILSDVIRKSPIHRRSMSWCPSDAKCVPLGGEINYRSYSLEGLVGDGEGKTLPQSSEAVSKSSKELTRPALTSNDDGSSFLYLKKGGLEATSRESRASERLKRSSLQNRGFSYSTPALSPPLTKSMSLVTIHQPGLDTQGRTRPKRRISFSFNMPPLVKSKNIYSFGSSSSDEESDSSQSLNSTSSSLAQSISEESCNQLPPSPLRKDIEGKGGISRTFSYIKNKMSSKKTKEKEKDKDKAKEKEKDAKEKEKDKKTLNGHHFTTTPIVGPMNCSNCIKPVTCKDAYLCSNCNSIVHKGCRESYASCAMVKMKQQKVLQAHDTSSLPTVVMRNKNSQTKERPRSAIVAPDENTFTLMISNRRPQTSLSLSKSVSIQNIAGAGNDENHLNTIKYLSRSTDSLNKMNNTKVTESMESLNDEGTDMNEGQLMGDFEIDSKQLEAESWSQAVDTKFLRQQKKDVVKRQDVIYELMQTEMHHVRTLKIMSDVYSRGMITELQFEQHMVEKIFPCLDDLLKIHNQFFQNILDRRKETLVESSDKNYVIKKIGDLLVEQFSGENAERMKKTYGKFCGHHNEAVNYFKDLHSKEKRFQAFMKKKMSSTVVRRLGIQECILLVTQRITKYPVLLQRILEYTKENKEEHEDLKQSLFLVKEVITAVNSKVNNYEKKIRLHEIYSKTDSKSIQRMKGGKMFAKEDLKRRKLIRDGPAFLKTATGRLKEVQAVLLSDTLVFLQEKDQKYVFASLEHRSTVISLKRLIVRDVAHEEKGLFLISVGEKDPEMVEVHTSSKEERNSWIQAIQDTMTTMGKDEDEGIPSESEEERKILDTKSKELKEQLQQKDKQILTLLNEKESIFRNLCCGQEDGSPDLVSRSLFRVNSEEALKGEEIVKTAIKEVETLQDIVTSNLGSTVGHQISSSAELGVVTPVSLPRRAETFGGFDSHQITSLKNGDRDEVDDNQDLRRTESDSVLKKGGNANFMLLLKRNSEQVLCSVSHLHELLSTLQAVVIQQDTYIEDQKLLLSEKTISRTLSKPNSLIEQEKQRSLEKQRQELANLQKQQAQHLEEKRKREREWESREKELMEREARLAQREEKTEKGLQELEKEREELQARKEEYQRDLERLRAGQKQLEKETEQLKRDMEQDSLQHDKITRTSSMTADCLKQPSSSSPKQDHLEPTSPKKDSLFRTDSKQKGKGPFHLLSTTNQTNKPTDRHFSLSKPKPKEKEKKEKKKKNKGRSEPADCPSTETAQDGEEIFC